MTNPNMTIDEWLASRNDAVRINDNTVFLAMQPADDRDSTWVPDGPVWTEEDIK
ncbi:hypothetical protein G7Y41_08845 [Schaalia sp. ZJ405]|uniref:hypothetical protein n=1 Tax=Schaalia sp. ZJ405 TaxID=2709403 RepID=UPI0013EB3B16|nr:hypothetical protein [Schaalia sp. ZJ405]QPK81132.1 hypothetical protein G7Y41_08845 [Schaalia sp. ZJ405]